KRNVSNYHFTYSSIEGGKQFIFGKNLRFGQQVHQGRFTNIGITNQSYPDHLTPVSSLGRLLLVNLLQLLLKSCYFIKDNSPVGLNLCFTRPPHTNSTPLSLKVSPHPGKPWQQILILCQFNLSFGMSSLGTTCKNIKNEVCAVKHLTFQFTLDISQLGWSQFIIEDNGIHFHFFDVDANFFKFTGSYKSRYMRNIQLLGKFFQDFCTSSISKECKFIQVFISLFFILAFIY